MLVHILTASLFGSRIARLLVFVVKLKSQTDHLRPWALMKTFLQFILIKLTFMVGGSILPYVYRSHNIWDETERLYILRFETASGLRGWRTMPIINKLMLGCGLFSQQTPARRPHMNHGCSAAVGGTTYNNLSMTSAAAVIVCVNGGSIITSHQLLLTTSDGLPNWLLLCPNYSHKQIICGSLPLQFVVAEGLSILKWQTDHLWPSASTVRCGWRPQHLKNHRS